MALFDDIRADSLTARRNRDTTRASALTTLIGEIQTKEKSFSPARPVTDADVIPIVRRFAENATETLRFLAGAGRDTTVAAAEVAIYSAYLPTLMTDDEVEAFARAHADGGTLGGIMAALKEARPGQYDGKSASAIIRRVLAG